uniref:NAD(+) ADP-ribosyltransferase n=1 Tax=Opuntia streptacantha TaxID=393608 RepID=A0A7C9CKA8_OPUST
MNSSMEDQTQFSVNVIARQRSLMRYSSSSDDDVDCASDCESSITGLHEGDRVRRLLYDNLVRLNEDDVIFQGIKRRFLSNFGDLGNETTIVAVHKKNWLGFRVGQAKLRCFGILAHAFAAESHGGGVANVVKYAWFGGGSKEEISRIMSHGFDHRDIHDQGGLELCLSPIDCPAQSVQNCVVDEDGLMHLLLCRVLLENDESINYGSSQFRSSSNEFDSDVDDIGSPTKYAIWGANMNTHILPEYVVTFTAPPCLMGSNSSARHGLRAKRLPRSPWMPIPALIAALSRILPLQAMNAIKSRHKDLKVRT